MTQAVFDKQDQLDRIVSHLIEGEEIIACYDCKGTGTGFVGVTNKRIILQDNSFVGGKVAISSIPYTRVTTVSMLSDKSMFGKFASSSEIHIQAGSKEYTALFRDTGKAKHIHDVIMLSLLG
jgi:PH (Pleckstrin Homology) domain-containing protein